MKATNLSLRYGNVEESAVAYTYFGMILHNNLNALRDGSEFLKLGVALNEKMKDARNQARILALRTTFGLPFEIHWKNLREAFDKVIEVGLRTGDAEMTVNSCMQALTSDPEMPLDVSLTESKKYENFINKKRFQVQWDLFKIGQLGRANLATRTRDRLSFSDKNFDEYQCLNQLK
jgi:predicted ATPase